MKKIYLLFLIVGALSFQACEGPMGPPGIDGLDGEDGEDGAIFLSTVLETGVNFTEENQYQVAFTLEILEGDNLLIYRALGADEEENIAWMPLPQTFFAEEGMIIYNYYFTKNFFAIFLDTSITAEELTAEWTENQYFRIVIVPGEFAEESADFSNYETVMEWLGKKENEIVKIEPK
jgi:hypothetical protein